MSEYAVLTQRDLFQNDSSTPSILRELCRLLPALPPAIRYYDEFYDTIRSIRNPAALGIFPISAYGKKIHVNFARFENDCSFILKHVFLYILAQDVIASTAAGYVSAAQHLDSADIAALVNAGPTGIARVWKTLRARDLHEGTYKCAKYILQLLCSLRLYGWSDEYQTYLKNALPLPAKDKYASVRSGDVFLSVDEEAILVRYLDDMVAELTTLGEATLSHEKIVDAAMLLCSYQFGMRRIQIAMLTFGNVRIWSEDDKTNKSVHLTFHMAKQRSDTKRKQLPRRVKVEWTPLFVYLKSKLEARGADANAKFFSVQSTDEVGKRISSLVRKLLESDGRGTLTDLRHTAAQRLVDAGASHEELAEFMGHSQVNTGLVYFATAASHAERVNRALGASEVYRRVAKIAHDRFISSEELSELKGERQIAGVPHGIPIAGIGGCSSGQPSCPYNPVASCYGCRRFMPLHNREIHQQVLADMREVVLFFDQSSRGDVRSPAYLQLQRTIAEIQNVIEELETSPE
ncbi:tyrosine-type recombinase/integrase [Massilia phyllosphaerae]|uniref:tyrosine-type recombinase/integrase n=1 Tax=Massilia phyllosphaerae TaxID=3106034 RepID=UPI002B1CA9FF|nr:tyrosine-type recombinase/integrase [Massilia sp. SGZ-792]